jgi:zinc/manganese transport system substrate-binding protein
VGGGAAHVVGLVKPGTDPHSYEPTPADLRQLGDARLVLLSGKELEHYFTKLQASAAAGARIVKVGDGMPSLEAPHDHGDHGHHHHEVDPHWWHSVANVEKATRIVRDALVEVEPAQAPLFEKNAAAYLAGLAGLEKWVKRKVAELPRDRRELVTSHDAFQYFAQQYGFRIHAIEGVSSEQEASAKDVAELIATIKANRVRAIFFEDTLNPKVSTEITRETGAKVGGLLYADGPGLGDAGTYEGMMKHNVTTIVEALK